MMCGNNPLYLLYINMLMTRGALTIPRFRDAYTVGPPEPRIVMYTRTGGKNRSAYERENAAMRAHLCYQYDYDDSFDSTFAHWEFEIPEQFRSRMVRLHELLLHHPKFLTPREKFNISLERMRGRDGEDPETYTISDEAIALMRELAAELGMSMLGDAPESRDV